MAALYCARIPLSQYGAWRLPIESLTFGLIIGAVIGAAAFPINFCALGGVADILFAKDWRRMRAWLLAAGVAMLMTQGLAALGIIARAEATAAPVSWIGVLVGGVMLGYGMALSGGCINRALVRVGAGSLKSLVIVGVVGLAAAAAQALVGRVPSSASAPTLPGFGGDTVRCTLAAICGSALVAFALAESWFRTGKAAVAGSIVIGLAIPAAWAASTTLGDPTSVNFAAAAGDLFSAPHGTAQVFGVAILAGVPVGSFLAAAPTRNLAFETFTDRAEFLRNVVGAVLMGAGGALALGDTFGQGLSGLSILSATAPVAIVGMFAGCLWGIRAFEAGGVWSGLKLTLTQLARR